MINTSVDIRETSNAVVGDLASEAVLLRKLSRVAGHVLGLSGDVGELTLESSLFDVGIDSMNVIDLVLAIEEELGVRFVEEDLSADLFRRSGNFVELMHRRLGEHVA